MTSYKLYEVFCIEEQEVRRVTSLTEPTQCPLSHNDRSIDPAQTILIDYKPILGNRVAFLNVSKDKISNKSYFNLRSNFMFDASTMEAIVDVKFLSYLDKKSVNGTYSLRIFDKTHSNVMGSINLSNETLQNNSLGELSNLPIEDAIIEFHAMVDDAKDKINIDTIAIYYKTIK